MPYRVQPDEQLGAGLRRCAAEEIASAIDELGDGYKADQVAAVHEARKSLKKIRALLRLVRPGLAQGVYRREMDAMRSAGQALSASRDADVVIAAFDGLRRSFTGQAPGEVVKEARAGLAAERRVARKHAGVGAVVETRDALQQALERVPGWGISDDAWGAAQAGVRRAYERGQAAFELALEEPTVEHLHDWRKRVKDLWYHQRLLEPLWPATMEAQAEHAHRLSELLGDDHDLAVLHEKLAASPQAPQLDGMLAIVDQRRADLQREAWPLGRRIYAERPKAFVRRLDRWRRAWEAERAAAALAPV